MTNLDQVLDALGDRTRRRVFGSVRSGNRSVSEIATDLGVTPSAISQHLRVLKDAGLVSARAAGTRRFYAVDRSGLESVRAWIEGLWDEALDAYRAEAERVVAARRDET